MRLRIGIAILCMAVITTSGCLSGSGLFRRNATGEAMPMRTDVPPEAMLVSQTMIKPEARETVRPSIVFGAGDEIEVQFFTASELNVRQRVRPDGRISLKLVGDVVADGKTPQELKSAISKAYADELRDPRILLLVHGLHASRVYVGGQVARPGVLPMPARMTVLEAIMQAGGTIAESAEPGSVVIIRPGTDGKMVGIRVDLSSALKGKTSHVPLLQPRDIVFVPRTRIVKINTWIEQHITRIIPKTGGYFNRTFPVGQGSAEAALEF